MALTARWQRLLHPPLSGERFKKCPRVLQVGGIKAFGEPAVDGCKEFIGFSPLALLSSGSPATRRRLAATPVRTYPPSLLPLPFLFPERLQHLLGGDR